MPVQPLLIPPYLLRSNARLNRPLDPLIRLVQNILLTIIIQGMQYSFSLGRRMIPFLPRHKLQAVIILRRAEALGTAGIVS